jgi:hypothetical protein
MTTSPDEPKIDPYVPLGSTSNEATATCYCGAVQLAFVSLRLLHPSAHQIPHGAAPLTQPIRGPGFSGAFVCHCADCRKITASVFASNFTVNDTHLKHLRGRDNLKTFGQSHTIASGGMMTNYFCRTCGTLMYRIGARFPGLSILRLGTVDDPSLVEAELRPTRELFVKDRAGWLHPIEGAKQIVTMRARNLEAGELASGAPRAGDGRSRAAML